MLREGAIALLGVYAAAVEPPEQLTVSQWAERHRVVSAESGSPVPGRWSNEVVPWATAIMDWCGFDDPCSGVVIMGSAQIVKSEIGLNTIGCMIHQEPGPTLVVLPSIDEARKYNSHKLDPTINATPALRERVLQVVSRDEKGSTTLEKAYRGGKLVITTASSSKGLQMISARLRIYEEVSEFPADVDGRGNPVDLGEARGKAWQLFGPKTLLISTPGIEGECQISRAYQETDQHKLYVPCPHCGHWQELLWEQMRWESDSEPFRPWFQCLAHGCVIEPAHKGRLIKAAVPIRTYPGDEANPAPPTSFPPEELERWRARPLRGARRGFSTWQAYSPFVPWESTVAEFLKAQQAGSAALKVFWQQGLGRAWKEQGEAPPADRLLERRESWPAKRIPPGVLVLTGATDVQGNRLEWAVWGWDRGLSGYLIDHGMIEGDPNLDQVWRQHDELLAMAWEDAWGRRWPAARWGIDSGYLSQRVYTYARRHVGSGRVMALDGRPAWKLPPIGTPRKVRFTMAGRRLAVMIHPVGTWDLKSEVYSGLAATVQGPSEAGVWPPRALRFNETVDRAYLEQITAEYLAPQKLRTTSQIKLVWMRKSNQPNEALDLAVYCLGLAHYETDGLSAAQWDELAAARLGKPEDVQLDLSRLWGEAAAARAVEPRMQPVRDARPEAAKTRERLAEAFKRYNTGGSA